MYIIYTHLYSLQFSQMRFVFVSYFVKGVKSRCCDVNLYGLTSNNIFIEMIVFHET